MAKEGCQNPLFLLDEIGKMSSDRAAIPASALLEAAGSWNRTPGLYVAFYLEVDFTISDVMFVATSNSMNIPAPAARGSDSSPAIPKMKN